MRTGFLVYQRLTAFAAAARITAGQAYGRIQCVM